MIRYTDWTTRLEAYCARNSESKFKYGEWDCCLAVSGAIEAMTGIDPAGALRGRYQTLGGARYLTSQKVHVAKQWLSAFVEYRAIELEMPEIDPPMAKRGDLLMIKWQSLGLVALDGQSVLVAADKGFARVSLQGVLMGARAWTVGEKTQ